MIPAGDCAKPRQRSEHDTACTWFAQLSVASSELHPNMTLLARSISALCVLGGVAAADPTVTVAPAKVHPGDPVLVTVTGTTDAPRGKAGGAELQFFPA